MENKINGNRTFVGSSCIENIVPPVGKVIAYFEYILKEDIQGTYQGENDEGLQSCQTQCWLEIQRSWNI